MNNRNQKNNGKKQQNHNQQQPRRDVPQIEKPTRMEIHLPELPNENDYVTITLDEYRELLAVATLFDAIERWAKAHQTYEKIGFEELLMLMGAQDEEDAE